MSNAPNKNENDRENGHTPVPPYPAEVAATWQAFRVRMRDDEAADGSDTGDTATPPAPEDSELD